MKEKLRDKYLLVVYVDSLFYQLVDCEQGTSTVDAYTEKLHDLLV